MNNFTLGLADGRVLEIEDGGQWIRTLLPQPDPNWKGRDAHGHEHAYVDGPDRYPTLTTEYGEPYWCDDCDEEHQDSWLVCRLCGDKVVPGTFVDSSPQWVSGPKFYTLDGEPITKEQGDVLMEEARRAHDEALRVRERPAIGKRVRLGEDTVTVVPTPADASDDQVTVMFDGTGVMETVVLDRLRWTTAIKAMR